MICKKAIDNMLDDPRCHFLHRMAGVGGAIKLPFYGKNGVVGDHFVVNSGFEKALPLFC